MAILISLLVTSVIYADSPASRICSVDDLQACKSCKSLTRVLSKADPDDGEYLHGAEWNGLYAAYVHDCQALGEDLLKRGANPNRGGALGSMIISVIGKWPHNNKKVIFGVSFNKLRRRSEKIFAPFRDIFVEMS